METILALDSIEIEIAAERANPRTPARTLGGSNQEKKRRSAERRLMADVGRRYRTRTDDPHRVKVMLYRLS